MTPEEKAAYINAQTALFRCEVEGMIAENQHRAHCGNGIAYGEEAFTKLRDLWDCVLGHNAIMTFFRS